MGTSKEEDMRQVAAIAGYSDKHRGLLHGPGDSITRPLCNCHGSSRDLLHVTEIAFMLRIKLRTTPMSRCGKYGVAPTRAPLHSSVLGRARNAGNMLIMSIYFCRQVRLLQIWNT